MAKKTFLQASENVSSVFSVTNPIATETLRDSPAAQDINILCPLFQCDSNQLKAVSKIKEGIGLQSSKGRY